jgi:hypothetical protein
MGLVERSSDLGPDLQHVIERERPVLEPGRETIADTSGAWG